MTPSDITGLVEARFPILMYQGYRLTEQPQLDTENNVILWPKELKLALNTYSSKAGIKKIFQIKGEDIDPLTSTVEKPFGYYALANCKTSDGVFIDVLEGYKNSGVGFTLNRLSIDDIEVVKLIPLEGLENVLYPLELSYFVDLKACIADDKDLPNECDINLICDLLEAYVGVVNSQYNSATESLDMAVPLKTLDNYEQQRREVEEKIKELRVLPGNIHTW